MDSNEIKFRRFFYHIFLKNSHKKNIQSYYWENFLERDYISRNAIGLNEEEFEKIEDILKEKISKLLLTKTKEDFLSVCEEIIRLNIFPYSYNGRDEVVLWTNFGLEKYSGDHNPIQNTLLLESGYENYMSDAESPIFQFLWVFTCNVLSKMRSGEVLDFLSLEFDYSPKLFFSEILRQQEMLEIEFLKPVFDFLMEDGEKQHLLNVESRIQVFKELDKFSSDPDKLYQKITEVLVSDPEQIVEFKKAIDVAMQYSGYDSEQKKAFKIEFVSGEVNKRIAEYFLILEEEIYREYSHIPYDKILSELWIKLLSNNQLRNIKIEFGQNTDNFGRNSELGKSTVASINPDNIMTNNELPILLARVAKFNLDLERLKKSEVFLGYKSTKIKSKDEDDSNIDLVGAVCGQETDGEYLVFSRPGSKIDIPVQENDTIKIKLTTLLQDFEEKTKTTQKTYVRRFKQMSNVEASELLRCKILQEFQKKDRGLTS